MGLQTAPKGKEATECTESKPTGAPALVRQECDDKWEGNIFKKAHGVGVAAAVRAREIKQEPKANPTKKCQTTGKKTHDKHAHTSADREVA